MLVLECGLDALVLDEVAFPDRDRDFVYPHLKYYLSKSQGFPAVMISVDRIPAVITDRHKYFLIARELGLQSIRAVVVRENFRTMQAFLRRSDVRVLDNARIAQEMAETAIMDADHVFFFEDPLSARAKSEFERKIAGFFRTIESPLLSVSKRKVSAVKFSFADTCAEFNAVTPVGDESWYSSFLRTSIEFSSEVAKICTYQGRRFVW
jgi:hypothetical protein